MIAYRNILISICVVVFSNIAMGQDVPNMVPSKLKSFGENSLQMGDTYSTIDYFEAYMAKRPNDDKVAFKLADSYRLARNYKEAEEWYKKAYDLDPKSQADALFYYAMMLKTEQQYDEALKNFNKYKKESSNSTDERQLKKILKDQIESCTKAKRLIDSNIVVAISPLDNTINKASVELSPYFLDDNNFIFASLRTDSALYMSTTDNNQVVPVRKFYKGTKKDATYKFVGEWKESKFNKEGINTGNGALSPDKKRFYFTRCERNWKYENICKIYKSEKAGNSWKDAEVLPEMINNPKYTSTQPAVGTDSKTLNEILYFVSNREDGKGGLDIWYALYDKKKKTWKEPKNCGGEINTSADEMTPYVDNENKKLYFSSNGLAGLGGLDIFKAIGEGNKYLPAENIGYPVNSPYDDLYYVLNSKKEEGLFVSNRPAGKTNDKKSTETCCDDIYSFAYNQVIKVAATGRVYAINDDEVNKILSEGFESTDKKTPKDTTKNKAVPGSIVSLYLVDKLSGNTIYIKNDTTDANGKFYFTLEPSKDYIMEFENYGNFNKKVKLSTKGIVKSDTMKVRPVGVNVMPKIPLIVKNIYYDFDRAELKTPAKRTLDTTVFTLMKQFPSIVIEISSHTDSKGDDEYNKKLSQKRAESVVNYLISKGIDANRLRAKGYGEEKPIAPNENADGTDNEAGRERNRRTEFRIIGSLSQYSEIIYEK